MNWDDLNRLLAIGRVGALADAGRLLKVNPTTVGRRLKALEESLGVVLFARTAEGYRPTEAGLRALRTAEGIAESIRGLERQVGTGTERPEGVVRVTSSDTIALHFLAPRLKAFAAEWPGLVVDLLCTHALLDLNRGEADLALRLIRPQEENLVARRLGRIVLGLFGSPEHLAQARAEGRPPDLLVYSPSIVRVREYDWMQAQLPRARVVMRTTSAGVLFRAAVDGMGLALLPILMAGSDPRLVSWPIEGAAPRRSLWLAAHPDVIKAPRVRVVADWLTAIFTRAFAGA